MNIYAQPTDLHEEYNTTHSSPFIRQGFGRISTTSGKFNTQKGLTLFPNNTMQRDDGHPRNMECNQILNYISHRSINGSQKDLEVRKNIEDFNREDTYKQMQSDIPSTRRYKVMKNRNNIMCYSNHVYLE